MGLSVVDCRAGALLWVQRKNGSWWPARVLETNELSPSHSIHRRPGTPIKLLGREDATVDWYNLEKSKRIKAFRCGEFDDCIVRAESSQANCSKKFVKYARREGAILHALQLEKQKVQKKHQGTGEEPVGTICQAKRSRRVYLPARSSNCWKRTAFHPEPWQVLSSKFEVRECPLLTGSAEDDAFSRSMETDSYESDSRCPDRVQEESQPSDAAILLSTQPSNSGTRDGKAGDMNGKGNHVLTSLSNSPPDPLNAAEVEVPRFKLKGKENICNLNKRKGGAIDVKNCVKFKKVIASSQSQSAPRSSHLEDLGNRCSDLVFTGFLDIKGTTLTDVELIVQPNYRRECVPLVSVMSRLNGKAIVGHLIDVEASDDGSLEILLPRKHEIGHNLFDNDGTSTLHPAWRTSKRTPVRYLPQPQPPPALKDDKNSQAFQNSGHLGLEARANRLTPTQEFLRKLPKKPSLSNQKTRILSSRDIEQKEAGNGLLKAKDSLPTRVTCVPVKQIFSKLLVAVGGAQS
ncbi:PWWP domain protein [Actinidia chinensis var. chinensis]|uniref:PWWP domain protein n=1 Tax=Actinidia chinensis var. chinensis TaxID=1590841 RepID=A0A2R6PHN9_ACTCC|nr:PWWP domain protein [Actinidia chinensis var. chinensis]